MEGRTLAMPIPPGRFWAKYDSSTGEWHPLVAHSADVAAVLARLLAPDSVIAARLARCAGFDRLRDSDVAVLTYLAALHDLGKANHGFQEKILPKEKRRRTWSETGHVKVVLASMKSYKPLQAIALDILRPIAGNPLDTFELLSTTICHHGRPHSDHIEAGSLGALWDPVARPGWDPLMMIRRLAALARRWSGLDRLAGPAPISLEPAFTHLFAGALTLADWIGSTRSAFEFAPWADDEPDRYWEVARERAKAACARVGLTAPTRVSLRTGTELLAQLFPKTFPQNEPTPVQRHVAQMPLPEPGSRLLIEAETGSGKTEAALALYARLRSAGHVGGLVFALPTRATAAAMHQRVLEMLPAAYGGGPTPTVALAMGGEQVSAVALERWLSEQPLEYPDAADRELARWSSSSAKKFFAAEIVVGTIDQALLAVLLVKHAHLRLAALSRHLLVVDELHSCDRYMGEVLARLLDFHTSAGGTALLVSATLSEVERRRYGISAAAEPTLAEAISRPYPVVSICTYTDGSWRDETLERTGGGTGKAVTWGATSEADGITAAMAAAAAGARVCVLRNTVKDARATIDKIRAAGGVDLLWRPPRTDFTPAYHSRYVAPDRRALDEAVLRAFGLGSPQVGTILVATQVVEQSLDIDFDLLITDLCPIDVLLQRIGRLHRHHRSRPPEFAAARVMVVAPDQPLVSFMRGDRATGPHGWGSVYEDLGDLELTLRLVRDPVWSKFEIPRDNRRLIEQVYHHEPRVALADESEAWRHAFIVNEGKNLGREVHAGDVSIRFDRSYSENGTRFDASGAERSIRTRLGDDRIRIDLGRNLPTFYADQHRVELATSVDIPLRVLAGTDLEAIPDIGDWAEDEQGVSFSINGKGPIRYDWHGWHWPE